MIHELEINILPLLSTSRNFTSVCSEGNMLVKEYVLCVGDKMLTLSKWPYVLFWMLFCPQFSLTLVLYSSHFDSERTFFFLKILVKILYLFLRCRISELRCPKRAYVLKIELAQELILVEHHTTIGLPSKKKLWSVSPERPGWPSSFTG